jgi:putative nucleotidyltransferase with HDIG domain
MRRAHHMRPALRPALLTTMRIDSYETPNATHLLQLARTRYAQRKPGDRVLITEAAGALAFLAGAAAISALAPAASSVPLSLDAIALTMAAYLIAAHVTFPVGSAWTRPTQLAFVPMLFLLPLRLVPVVVATCSLLDLWPHIVRRDVSLTRVFARLGDSVYCLGPVVVLVLAHAERFSWHQWPIYAAAFGAQVLCDAGCGLARSWFAERISPSEQLEMAWLYLIDGCLACVGLLVAAPAADRPGLVLLTIPLFVLLGQFAGEREQRLSGTLELSTAYRGTALLLGTVVEADHEYTGIHSREVVDLALAVSDELGLDPVARQNVEFGALLHDVGKIRVPKEIINKPGQLDDREWAIMRRHTIDGEAMLRQVGGLLAQVGAIVRASHERWDGHGYPDGLAREEIPIEARIVTACDAYNAMTTDRGYRAALSPHEALEEILRCSGTQFDPKVVKAMLRIVLADARTAVLRGRGPGGAPMSAGFLAR